MKNLHEALSKSKGQTLWAGETPISMDGCSRGTCLEGLDTEVQGKSIIILVEDQLTAALALIELDGVAKRLVLCPPDVQPSQIRSIAADAEAEAILVGPQTLHSVTLFGLPVIRCGRSFRQVRPSARGVLETEWALITSGTTGPAKMVIHRFDALYGSFANSLTRSRPLWATFYDIRRYGGLQVFLRAMLGGGSIVLSRAHESQTSYLQRLAVLGVTHISGTPSHWRQALQCANLRGIDPECIRLSGEIADQAIIDRLRAAFPKASICHAYASTEAGVVFEVDDFKEGFPDDLVSSPKGDVEIEVRDDTLRVRSNRAATGYLGSDAPRLKDARGFIDMHDVVSRCGDRWFFAGRDDGVINVGGFKVHPEEVEAIINRHAHVRMSLVTGRRNPIIGEIVVADVVLDDATKDPSALDVSRAEDEIIQICRDSLPSHKIPAMVRIVTTLETSPSGKLRRRPTDYRA